MNFTKEDFDEWRGNHVTEAVFKALAGVAEEAKEAWIAASWNGANCDPLLLRELKSREAVALGFVNMDFEWLEEKNEDSK